MLDIRDLRAGIGAKPILNGVSLAVPDGQVHAIMGPNGSGKSTLAYVLSGREGYDVTGGSATFDGADLLAMEPERRASAGVFLAFQYPVELPGVGNANFLRTALNAQRRARGETELDAVNFLKLARAETRRLAMPDDMLKRNVNVGFSGGEKKRNEVLQMAILRPRLAILDETDSGLDIDALRIVAEGVNALRGPHFSALVITHYQRLLDYIVPDRVHVLSAGRVVRSGGPDLARELEFERLCRARRRGAARMNAIRPNPLADTTRHFLSRYEGLAARLSMPHARAEAVAAFRAHGLPTPREEAWHYTNLRPLAGMTFAEPLVPVGRSAEVFARLPAIDAPRVVFVDGRFDADLSVLPTACGVRTGSPPFGAVARPEHDRLVALNGMLTEDGAAIEVPAGADAGTLLLANLSTDVHGRPISSHPRHALRLGRGARLVLLELAAGDGTYLHNPVLEIALAEGATLTHLRLQDELPQAFHLSSVHVRIAARATYDSFALTLGARLARMEVHAQLAGPGAAAHLNAAQLLGGTQHADFTTVVAHEAPSCASRQTVKSVLTGRSHGVFQGRIEVARVAQKTDGYQMNQALLLSEHAEMNSKPQLEIYADDVKCSHGATVGALDADQAFYLRSRGIPEAQAREMLVRAFLAEAIDPIAHEAGRAWLEAAVAGWWERQS